MNRHGAKMESNVTPNVLKAIVEYINACDLQSTDKPPLFTVRIQTIEPYGTKHYRLIVVDGSDECIPAVLSAKYCGENSVEKLYHDCVIQVDDYVVSRAEVADPSNAHEEKYRYALMIDQLTIVNLENGQKQQTIINRQLSSLNLKSLTPTYEHDWIRVTVNSAKRTSSGHAARLVVYDSSGNMTCTVFEPIFPDLFNVCKQRVILEVKNSRIQNIDSKFKVGENTMEMKFTRYTHVKAIDPVNGSVLYEYTPSSLIDSLSQPNGAAQNLNLPESRSTPSSMIPTSTKLYQHLPDQVTNGPFTTIASLQPTYKHDWVRVNIKSLRAHEKCVRLMIYDDTATMPATIFDPHLRFARHLRQETFIFEIKDACIKPINPQFKNGPNDLEMIIGSFAKIKVIEPDYGILYQYPAILDLYKPKASCPDNAVENIEVESLPLANSSFVHQSEHLSTQKTGQSFLTIASLTVTETHDWLRVIIQSLKFGNRCARLLIRDETDSLSCTIFDPILTSAQHFLKEGLILELKNTKIQEIAPQFRTGTNILEMKLNKYAMLKAIDPSDGSVLYEYSYNRPQQNSWPKQTFDTSLPPSSSFSQPNESVNWPSFSLSQPDESSNCSMNQSRQLPHSNTTSNGLYNLSQTQGTSVVSGRPVTTEKYNGPRHIILSSVSALSEAKKNDTVDIVGVLKFASPVQYKMRKGTGSSIQFRSVTIADNTGEVTICLWNNRATNFNFKQDELLCFKNVGVNEWCQKKELIFKPNSCVTRAPKNPR